MNTNRGSYLLGAALGSALVLALCAPVMAADIYDGGLKGGYDVPPPPPSDRGIYFKGYIGQANPDVGSMWTEGYDDNTLHAFITRTSSRARCSASASAGKRSHWLRFDLTGEYRGDAVFVGHDSYPGGGGFDAGTNEYTADIKSWLGLANAYIDMGNWCGFTPYIGAGIGFASITRRGLEGRQHARNGGAAFGADHTNTNFAWALYAGVSYDVTPQTVIDLSLPLRRPRNGAERRGHRLPRQRSPTAACSIKDITSNDLMLGVRYKLQREAVVYQPVK